MIEHHRSNGGLGHARPALRNYAGLDEDQRKELQFRYWMQGHKEENIQWFFEINDRDIFAVARGLFWHKGFNCTGCNNHPLFDNRDKLYVVEGGDTSSRNYICECTREFYKDQLRTMPYAKYLRTEHWQSRREGALRLAGNRCQLCGETRSLQVHHNSYARRGNEADSDLIVLCRGCHDNFHKTRLVRREIGA